MGGYHLHLEKSGNFWTHPENWQSSVKIRTVLKSSRKLALIWKNPDNFEIDWKIGSHLEKSGQFWNHPENAQSSGKIRTVLKSSGKLAGIWKIRTVLNSSGKLADIWKIWTVLKWSGNWQSSGKIQTVLKPSGKLEIILENLDGQFKRFFSYIRAKTFRTRKNFPGSNATLLTRFLRLCY